VYLVTRVETIGRLKELIQPKSRQLILSSLDPAFGRRNFREHVFLLFAFSPRAIFFCQSLPELIKNAFDSVVLRVACRSFYLIGIKIFLTKRTRGASPEQRATRSRIHLEKRKKNFLCVNTRAQKSSIEYGVHGISIRMRYRAAFRFWYRECFWHWCSLQYLLYVQRYQQKNNNGTLREIKLFQTTRMYL